MIQKGSERMLQIAQKLIYAASSSQNNIDYVEAALPKLVMNKPAVLNSLSVDMIQRMTELLPELDKSPAFWLEGAGGKAFCAGGDVKNLWDGPTANYGARQNFFRKEFTLDYALTTMKSIQIVNWDGIVMGGGIGVSIHAPYRIATEKTMLAMPEAKIGFYTDVGSSYVLARIRNNIGMYIALTSGRLKGEDVYNSGFANYFVAKDSVPKIYDEISMKIKDSTNPKQTIEEVLNKYHIGSADKKISNEEEIKQIFEGKSVAEIYEKAKASGTPFAASVVKAMDEVCPESMHIIYKLIKDSQHMSLQDVFKRDFLLAQYFSQNKNFEIGVRSLLIDKTNNPQWTHKNFNEVTPEEVEKAFLPHPTRTPLKI